VVGLEAGCDLDGLATCFGATTVTPGSGVADPAVCDIAVPLSKAVDRMATAEAATKLDDNLMTVSSQIQAGCAIPIRPRYHGYSFFRTSASQGS
jgi:hypothetical protein